MAASPAGQVAPAIAGALLTANETIPVPRRLLQPLWFALGASAASIAVSTIVGATREGYDAWHQAVSALSLGPGGWVQAVNFVVVGSIIAGTAPIWRRILAGGRGATAYPILMVGLGVGLIMAGVVPQDPAPGYDPAGLALESPTVAGLLHLAFAGVAAGCSVAGLFVMATRFAGDPVWRGWDRYSRVLAGLTIVCVIVYGVWSTEASGLAGTFERIAFLIPLVWAFTLLRRLWAGVPFMMARGTRGASA